MKKGQVLKGIVTNRFPILILEIDGDIERCLYINDVRKESGYLKPVCELRRLAE